MDDAAPLMESVATRRIATMGISHPETIAALQYWGFANWRGKRFDKGVEAFSKALEGCQTRWGDQNEETCATAFNLAFNYRDNGQSEQALAVLEEWLPKGLAVEWGDSELLRGGLRTAIELYLCAGRPFEAGPQLPRLVAEIHKSRGTEAGKYSAELHMAGSFLVKTQAFSEAESVLREALQIREAMGPDALPTSDSKSLLGAALLGQKKFDEAEPLLLAGYQGMKLREATILEPAKVSLPEAIERLVQLYEATDNKDEAAKWRKKLDAIQSTEKVEKQP
jgi:tetratricopeptide (TPR) repeat protein